MIEGPNKIKPIVTLLASIFSPLFLIFAILVVSTFFKKSFQTCFLYYFLVFYQKLRYPFKSNNSKNSHTVHKIKNKYAKVYIDKHTHKMTHFCGKDNDDLRYCFAINSFFVRITLELKITNVFFKINPTL